jgi:choline dehydrogenase
MCPLDIVGLDTHHGGLLVAHLRPFSRGRLLLRSADPHAEPQLDFRMLSDARDRRSLRQATRHAAQILEHKAIASISTSPVVPLPNSEDELDQWLLASCQPFTHAAGTCRMGGAGDPRSVVDPTCRVIGVQALRVADASILPSLPSAAPLLTVVMLAEHLARRLDATPDRPDASSTTPPSSGVDAD